MAPFFSDVLQSCIVPSPVSHGVADEFMGDVEAGSNPARGATSKISF